MANKNIKGITIEIGGDTSKLQKSLNAVNAPINKINKELKDLNQALKLDPKNTELLAQKQDVLKRNIEASTEKLNALKDAQKQFGDYSKLTDEQKAAYNKLSLEIAKSEDAIKSMNKELKETNNAKFESLKDNLKKVGNIASTTAKAVAGIATGLIAAAGATAKAIASNVKEIAAYGDEVDKESQKLNISAANYQKLSYAMDMSGSSISDVSKGMKTIVSDLGKMSEGVKSANDKYKKLGISLKNSDGSLKSSEQVLLDSIDALSKMENETKRNAYAQQIFGKSAAELTPLLNSGSEGIRELMQEAEDYGMVMNDDAVEASALFDDSLTRLKGTMRGLKTKALSPFIMGITQLMNAFSGLVSGVNKTDDAFKLGINTIKKAVQETLPQIIDTITKLIPTLLPIVAEILLTISKTIIKNLPIIIKAGIEVLLALIKGITEMMPELIPTIVDCILIIVDTLLEPENIKLIVNASFELIKGIIEGIILAIPKIIEKVPDIVKDIAKELKNNVDKMYEAGKELIEGMWNGLKAKWDYYKATGGGSGLVGWAKSVVEDIMEAFGIHSPSTVMRDKVGKNLGLGIVEGIKDTKEDVEEAMSSLATGVEASVNPTINPTANTNPLYITIDKFYNNRETDIQQLAEELEFYRRNSALAKGGM